jgi:hypothetical protein
MIATKSMMLGFPSAIFWAILGGYCYQESLATWDIYYFVFFAGMGMTVFCMFAMYGLRTKKEESAAGDELIDESSKDEPYIDEVKEKKLVANIDNSDNPSPRVQAVRDRANRRRTTGVVKKSNWGEFK